MKNAPPANSPAGSASQDSRIHTHSKDADASVGEHRNESSTLSALSWVAENAEDSAKGVYEQVKNTTDAMTKQTAEAVSGGIDAGARYVKEGSAQASEQIRKYPSEALLVAGLVGLLLGVILAR